MRTTIAIADDLYAEAKELADGRSFNDFASEAIQERVLLLKRKKLAQEMEDGYRAEAAASSLDSEWSSFEVEGL
jgi:predicted CopG family antitoxin